MIHHVKGDLLKSDCTFIGHQANCQRTMGSGIARQIAADLPDMARVDRSDMRASKVKLGNFTYTRIPNGWGFNLYGQLYYGQGLQTDYKALEKAIDRMLTIVPELARFDLRKLPVKVGFPYKIGAGLAGGDWDIIYEILERLSNKHSIDIWLYEFTP